MENTNHQLKEAAKQSGQEVREMLAKLQATAEQKGGELSAKAKELMAELEEKAKELGDDTREWSDKALAETGKAFDRISNSAKHLWGELDENTEDLQQGVHSFWAKTKAFAADKWGDLREALDMDDDDKEENKNETKA